MADKKVEEETRVSNIQNTMLRLVETSDFTNWYTKNCTFDDLAQGVLFSSLGAGVFKFPYYSETFDATPIIISDYNIFSFHTTNQAATLKAEVFAIEKATGNISWFTVTDLGSIFNNGDVNLFSIKNSTAPIKTVHACDSTLNALNLTFILDIPNKAIHMQITGIANKDIIWKIWMDFRASSAY